MVAIRRRRRRRFQQLVRWIEKRWPAPSSRRCGGLRGRGGSYVERHLAAFEPLEQRLMLSGDPLVSIAATDALAGEAGDTAALTVTRTGDTTNDLAVQYQIAGTAIGGIDYAALSGSVTIASGETDATIVITPIDDADHEGHETVTITLTDGIDYDLAASPGDSAAVTLLDDDNNAPQAFGDTIAAHHDTVFNSLVSLTDTAGSPPLAEDADGDALVATLIADAAHGSVTMQADGSYTYTPDAGYLGADSFTYQLDDGIDTSAQATVTIDVFNETPWLTGNSYSIGHNQSLDVDQPASGVLANDWDWESDTMAASLVAGPAHGTVQLNADGTFIYTPDDDYVGPDSFTYRANDGYGDSDPAAVNIDITNAAPVAGDDDYALLHDTALVIDDAALGVLVDDTDADTFGVEGVNVSGAGESNVNQLYEAYDTFNGKPRYRGVDNASYYIEWDGSGTWKITDMPGFPDPFFAYYTAAGSDDLPPTSGWSIAMIGMPPNPTVTMAVGGDTISAQVIDQPQHGSLTFTSDGTFTYTPEAGYVGSDSFTYRVHDGYDDSNLATVSLSINNQPPATDTETYSLVHDTTLTVDDAADGVLAGDSDADGDALTAVLVDDAQNGSLQLNADGTFIYTPDAGFVGDDSFTYRASDGAEQSATTTVTLSVTNAAPVAGDDSYTIAHDQTLSISDPALGVLADDSDPDNGGGDVEVTGAGDMGVNQLYEPYDMLNGKTRYRGVDNDAYYIEWDGSGTWKITDALGMPDPFFAYYTASGSDDVPPTDGWTMAMMGMPPNPTVTLAGGGETITAQLVDQPLHGSVTVNADGTFTYTPDAGYVGNDTFTYRATDGIADSNLAVVDITITNAVPVAVDDAYETGMNSSLVISDSPAAVLANDADADSDALSTILVDDVQHGTLQLNGDGTFTYTPDTDYSGNDSFTYRASDGFDQSALATVNIDITADVPTSIDDGYTIAHDTVLSVTAASLGLLDNDELPPGASVGVTISGAGSNEVNQVYEPDGTFNGKPRYRGVDATYLYIEWDGFGTWWITDAPGMGDPFFTYYTVSGSDDAPPATGWGPGMFGMMPAPTASAGGGGLTAELLTQPAHGSVTLNSDGTFIYTPDADYVGDDTFTYRAVLDGIVGNAATVTITLTNAAPAGQADAYSVALNTALDVTDSVLDNDTDADGDALSGTLVDDVQHGSLQFNSDGTFTYTPDADYSGDDSFTYRAGDGLAQSDPITVTLTVTDNRPTATDDAYSTGHNDALSVTDAALGLLANDAAPPGASTGVTIAGAGMSQVNQLYEPDGTHNGKTRYRGVDDDSFYIEWKSGYWSITDMPGGGDPFFAYYMVASSADTPPDTGWGIGMIGMPPNPTASAGSTLTGELLTQPLHGSVTLSADGTFTYTPAGDYVGDDTFTYRPVHDGIAGDPATVTVTVTNAAPVGQADDYNTALNAALSITDSVLDNDSDGDGDALVAALVDDVQHGSLQLNGDGTFIYTPDSGYFGFDGFTYRAGDGFDQSDPVAVTIEVINVTPEAFDDQLSVTHDQTLVIVDPQQSILANDDAGVGMLPWESAGDYEVVGAGSANANQAYVQAGNLNGKPYYRGLTDDSYYIEWTGDFWVITQDHDAPPFPPYLHHYQHLSATGDTPPADGWQLGVVGTGPAPTLDVPTPPGPTVTIALVADVTHGSLSLGADGSLSYTPSAGYVGQDSFTYRINDGSNDSNIATVTIDISNAAPVANDDVIAVDMDGSATAFIAGVIANDVDADDDALVVELVGDVAHGALQLNSDGSLTYTPDAAFAGQDTFTYRVFDTIAYSPAATVTIDVLDTPADAVDDVYAVAHNGQLLVDQTAAGLLGNDDPGVGPPVTIELLDDVAHGTLSLNTDGTFTFTPDADYIGADYFTYRIDDGFAVTAPALVTINVTNDPPVAATDAYSVLHDNVLSVADPAQGILANDSDLESDALSASLLAGAQHGMVNVNSDGTFTYTPDAGYFGADSFSYTVTDAFGGETIGTADITVRENDPPLAVDDDYVAIHSRDLIIDAPAGVLANDSDPDPNPITAVLVADAAHGSVALSSDGSFIYTPDAGYLGVDTFTYRAFDGTVQGDEATVSIELINHAPQSTLDVYAAIVNRALGPSVSVLANDADPDGDAMIAQLDVAPQHGSLTLNSDGTFSYTPDIDFVGSDSFTYLAHDGLEAGIAAVVVINVAPNHAPVAGDDAYLVDHDAVFVADRSVLDNDWDLDGDTLTVSLVDDVQHGSLAFNADGTFSYTPDAGYVGDDSFTYQLADADDAVIGAVTITVGNAAVAGNDDVYSVLHDQSLAAAAPEQSVTFNDFDADGDALTVSLQTDVAHGTLALNSDGTFSYTPDAGYVGADSFTYQVADGFGSTATAAVTINVTNHAPDTVGGVYGTYHDRTLIIDAAPAGLARFAHDLDGDAITYELVADAAHGTVSLGSDGTFSYTPDAGYVGSDTFTWRALDGATPSPATAVTIAVTNNTPVGRDDSYVVLHDTSLVVSAGLGLQRNDVDAEGDALAVVLAVDFEVAPMPGPQHGTLDLLPDGSFTYTPDAGYVGEDSFAYVLDDGATQSELVTVRLLVTNEAPQSATDFYHLQHDTALDVDALAGVLANDFDLDETDVMTATVTAAPAHGSLSLNADGSFIYTPDAGFVGTDSFVYAAGDGQATSGDTAVTLLVENIKPVAYSDAYNVLHDSALVTDATDGVLVNDFEPDEDDTPLVTLVDDVAHGTLQLNSDGTFTFTPDAGYVGSDYFTYRINDGAADSAIVTATIEVINHEPFAVADVYEITHDTLLSTTIDDGVLANDDDLDELDTLTATLIDDVQHGTLNFNADGTFTYTPDAGYVGEDVFFYVTLDAAAATAPTRVDLLVVNHAPLTVDDAASANEDPAAPLIIDVLGNDTDEDGDALTLTLIDAPLFGTAEVVAGMIEYTPDADFNGEDSIIYAATDPFGEIALGVVTITVDPVNDAPVAEDVTFELHADATLEPPDSLLLDAFDADYDDLAVTLDVGPAHGSLALNADGTFSYTPDAGYIGADSFSFVIDDGTTTSDPVTVSLDVTNAAPVASDIQRYVYIDSELNMAAGTGLAAYIIDGDDGGADMTYEVVAGPAHGSLSVAADGSFVYTPDAAYVGDDTFTFRAHDGYAWSNTASVALKVTDDVIIAHGGSYKATHGQTLTMDASFGVMRSAWHVNGYAMTVVLDSDVSHGTLNLDTNSGSFTYTSDAAFTGDDSFSYHLTDGSAVSDTVTVTLAVANRAPALVGGIPLFAVRHDQTLGVDAEEGLLIGAYDEDDDALAAAVDQQPQHGTVTVSADGSFTYTPDAGFVGEDSFTYTVTDQVTTSEPQTVSLVVWNDQPFAQSAYVRMHHADEPATGSVLLSASDSDGDVLTVTLINDVNHGSLTLDAQGAYAYTPDVGFVGLDRFEFEVHDGAATAQGSIEIEVWNSAPIARAQTLRIHQAPDATLTGNLLTHAESLDGDDLDVVLVEGPGTGAFSVDVETGAFVFTPTSDFVGTATVRFAVTDGVSTVGPISTTLIVENGEPKAVGDYFVMQHGVSMTLPVIANDLDPDDDPLTWIVVNDPAGGTIADDNGDLVYTANPGFFGVDSFQYVVTDGVATSSPATVVVNVQTELLLAISDMFAVDAGKSLEASVAENDQKPANYTMTLIQGAGHGALSLQADGSFTYTPDPGYVGEDSFQYRLSDGVTESDADATLIVTGEPLLAMPDVNKGVYVAAIEGNVAANDILGSIDAPVTASLKDAPAHGSVVVLPDGSYTYNPAGDYVGEDSFTYEITDGLRVVEGSVVVHVTNTAPDAAGDLLATDEDTALDFTTDALVANDNDVDGTTLTDITVTRPPRFGVLTELSDGQWQYMPDADFAGNDAFFYRAVDLFGATSNEVRVAVTVGAVDDPTIAVDDHVYVKEDGLATINVLANDTDIDGIADPASLMLSYTNPSHGSLTLNGTQFEYQPDADYHGSDSFTYSIAAPGGTANEATVSIDVTAINDAPQAVADSAVVDEDTFVIIAALDNDTDSDNLETGAVQPRYVEITSGPSHGVAVWDHSGGFTYTPDKNYSGSDSFTYQVYDADWTASNPATVNITVNPVNDGPAPTGPMGMAYAPNWVEGDLDEPGSVTGTIPFEQYGDIDGDTLSLINVTPEWNGQYDPDMWPEWLSVDVDGTSISVTAAEPGTLAAALDVRVHYTVSDGNGGTADNTAHFALQPPAPPTGPTVIGADQSYTLPNNMHVINHSNQPITVNFADQQINFEADGQGLYNVEIRPQWYGLGVAPTQWNGKITWSGGSGSLAIAGGPASDITNVTFDGNVNLDTGGDIYGPLNNVDSATLTADGDIYNITVPGHLSISARDAWAITAGDYISSVNLSGELRGSVHAPTRIDHVSANRISGSVSTDGSIISVSARRIDGSIMAGGAIDSVLVGPLDMGTIGLLSVGDGSMSGTITAGQDIDTVFIGGDLTGSVTAQTITESFAAGRDIAGTITLHGDLPLIEAGRDMSGSLSIDGDITNVTAGRDLSSNILSVGDIDKVHVGRKLTGNVTSTQGGINEVIAGEGWATAETTAGQISSSTIRAATYINLVQVNAARDHGGSIVGATIDAQAGGIGGVAAAGALGATIISAQGIGSVTAASVNDGELSGSITAQTTIGTVRSLRGNISATITAATTIDEVYASGEISGPITAGQSVTTVHAVDGSILGAVTATAGGIESVTAGIHVAGVIDARQNIGTVVAGSDITAQIKSHIGDIATVTAGAAGEGGSITADIIAVAGDIGTVKALGIGDMDIDDTPTTFALTQSTAPTSAQTGDPIPGEADLHMLDAIDLSGGMIGGKITAGGSIEQISIAGALQGEVTATGNIGLVWTAADVAAKINSTGGNVSVISWGQIAAAVTAHHNITIAARGDQAGDVTSATGSTDLATWGKMTGKIAAGDSVAAWTYGELLSEVDALAGSFMATAWDDFKADVQAHHDITVTALSAIDGATVESFGGKVDAFVSGVTSGFDITAASDVLIDAFDQIDVVIESAASVRANTISTLAGSINAANDVILKGTGIDVIGEAEYYIAVGETIAGEFAAAKASIIAWLTSNITLHSEGLVEIWAREDVGGEITTAEDEAIKIFAGRNFNATVTGHQDVMVECIGAASGQITSLNGGVSLTSYDAVTTNIQSKQDLVILTPKSISGEYNADGGVFMYSAEQITGTITGDQGIDLQSFANINATIIGGDTVSVAALGNVTGSITAVKDAEIFAGGSVSAPVTSSAGSAKVNANSSITADVKGYVNTSLAARTVTVGSVIATTGAAHVIAYDNAGVTAMAGTSISVTAGVEATVNAEITEIGGQVSVTSEGAAVVTAKAKNGSIAVVSNSNATVNVSNAEDAIADSIHVLALGTVAGTLKASKTISVASLDSINNVTATTFDAESSIQATAFSSVSGTYTSVGSLSIVGLDQVTGTYTTTGEGALDVAATQSISATIDASADASVSAFGRGAQGEETGTVAGDLDAVGVLTVYARGDITAPIDSQSSVNVTSLEGSFDSAIVAGQNVIVFAGADITQTVTAGDNIDLVALGSLSAAATATNGNASIVAFGGQTGTVTAGDTATVYVPSVAANITAKNNVDVFAPGGVVAEKTIKSTHGSVAIDTLDDILGAVDAKIDANVYSPTDIDGTIIAHTGEANVTAGGNINNTITGVDVSAVAVGSLNGTIDASGRADVVVLGQVVGNINAQTMADVWVRGNLLGNITVGADGVGSAGITTYAPILGAITVGGTVELNTTGNVGGPIHAGNSATIFTRGDVTGDVTVDDGGARVTALGNIANLVIAQDAVTLSALLTVAATVLSGGNVYIDSVGTASVNVTAGGNAVVTASDSLIASVNADNDAIIIGESDVDVTVNAANSAMLIAQSGLSGSAEVGSNVSAIAIGNVNANFTAGQSASVVTMDDYLGGVVSAGGAASVSAVGLMTNVTATGDEAVSVFSGGSFMGSATSANGGVSGYFGADATFLDLDAGTDVSIMALGSVHAPIDAGRDAAAFVEGDLSGSITAVRDVAVISLSNVVTPIDAGQDVYVAAVDSIGSTSIVAGRDVGLAAYEDIGTAVDAGRDITGIFARGNITGDFFAANSIAKVHSYAQIDAVFVAGDPAEPTGLAGYGTIESITAWGSLAGSITAEQAVVDVRSGDTVTAVITSPSATSIVAHDHELVAGSVPQPQISLASAHAQIMAMQRDVTLARAEIDQAMADRESSMVAALGVISLEGQQLQALLNAVVADTEQRVVIGRNYTIDAYNEQVEQVQNMQTSVVTWSAATVVDLTQQVAQQKAQAEEERTLRAQGIAQMMAVADAKMVDLQQAADNSQQMFDQMRQIAEQSYDNVIKMYISRKLDELQMALDAAGFIPVVGDALDVVNGFISLARGNFVDAGLSFISVFPLLGDTLAKPIKAARWAKKARSMKRAVNIVDNVSTGVRLADSTSDTVRLATRFGDEVVESRRLFDAGHQAQGSTRMLAAGHGSEVSKLVDRAQDTRRRAANMSGDGCFVAGTEIWIAESHDALAGRRWGDVLALAGIAGAVAVTHEDVRRRRRRHALVPVDASGRRTRDIDGSLRLVACDDAIDEPTSPLGHRHGSLTAATRLSLVTDASEAIIADPAPCVDAISSNDPVMDACAFNTAADSDQPPAGGLGRRWLAVACLLVAVFAGVLVPGSFGRRVAGLDGASQASLAFNGSVGQNTRAIEDVRLGDNVLADNPTGELDTAFGHDIDPRQWRAVTLRAPKVDGTTADVELLRPTSWLDERAAQVGSTIHIAVPECGIDGNATVLSIGPCPPIRDGSGRTVTGIYRHVVPSVLDLRFEAADGTSDMIGTTPNHPFWSEAEQSFVRADALRVSDRVRAATGQLVRLTNITPRDGPVSVYNLEVHLDHVYHVGRHGVLVHNGIACSRKLGNNLGNRAEMVEAGYEAHHIVPGGMGDAKRPRVHLDNLGIDINDADNGVWLEGPRIHGNHRKIHTPRYVEEIEDRIIHLDNATKVRAALREIGEELKAGTFPY